MRALLFAATLIAAPAHAGGLGLMGTLGMHAESVYYYSKVDPDTFEDEEPIFYQSINDYDQYRQRQNLLTGGGGLELILGDRDDMINGSFRAYYQMDSAQKDPSGRTDAVPTEFIVAAWREKPRHIGIGLIGLNWGIVEFASDRLRLGVSAHVGSGFVTIDHTEFFMASVGPALTYKANRQLHVFADVNYQPRVRQTLSHSGAGNVGVRYFFD